jgi:hypothetical protein
MTNYRLLERLNPDQEWQPEGVAYLEEGMCLFYRRGLTMGQPVTDLAELSDVHFPRKEDSVFRWGPIAEWKKPEPFNPAAVLQAPVPKIRPERRGPRYYRADDLPLDIRKRLLDTNLLWSLEYEAFFRDEFIALQESGKFPYRLLVEAFWRRWTAYHKGEPPFADPMHNVALLLYARAFGFPVDENSAQMEYLTRYASLYAPLMPPRRAWGARASLSDTILVALDSPVVHVWVYEEAQAPAAAKEVRSAVGEREVKTPVRIVIAGLGLATHRERIMFDALVTAMRVRAGQFDMINDGLVVIERDARADKLLTSQLPILGANAPLADAETAEAAMRELIRRLDDLSQETGFVQVHKVEIGDAEKLRLTLEQCARAVLESGEVILWAPEPSAIESSEELATLEPVLEFSRTGRLAGRRPHVSRVALALNPELLGTESWKKLADAFEEHMIRRLQMDAHIRLEFYQGRAEGLRAEKKQWDTADEHQRVKRWGPTITLPQRFDDALGLTVWLRQPTIMPTKQYYEANVPGLIQSYEDWTARMENLLRNLRDAAQRADLPFRRLITSRCFDAALRGRDIGETLWIQKIYHEWAGPMTDLLCFEWRRRLAQAKPEDLFTAHTTFNLVQYTDDQSMKLTGLIMTPYTLFDAKRSVALFDPERGFMVVNDASDYPQALSQPTPSVNLRQALQRQIQDGADVSQVNEHVRDMLIQDPQAISRQIIEMTRLPIGDRELAADSNAIRQLEQRGESGAAFPHLLDLAGAAMDKRALLTARESLEQARASLPDLLKRLSERQADASKPALPDQRELECRLYLLIAIAECLATDHVVKDYLPAVYHTPHAGGRQEIHEALAAAANAHPDYAREWIEYLSQWDLSAAYNKLKWGLPSEQDLTTFEENSAMRAFDAVELAEIAAELRNATAQLSQARESPASALVKLGPALDRALLTYAASVVYGDLVYILEALTGREVPFNRGA